MKDLLKYTYLLNTEKLEKRINYLWRRYQKILDDKDATFDDLNEARAILYFLGYLYPEKVALEAIENRVKYIEPKITIHEFLKIVDGNEEKALRRYQNNEKFKKLKEFYLLVKGIKNRVKNGSYLDEDRFNEIYLKAKPKKYF